MLDAADPFLASQAGSDRPRNTGNRTFLPYNLAHEKSADLSRLPVFGRESAPSKTRTNRKPKPIVHNESSDPALQRGVAFNDDKFEPYNLSSNDEFDNLGSNDEFDNLSGDNDGEDSNDKDDGNYSNEETEEESDSSSIEPPSQARRSCPSPSCLLLSALGYRTDYSPSRRATRAVRGRRCGPDPAVAG